MRQNDIRPDGLVCENAKLQLIDSQNILKNKHKFVSISCPACNSLEFYKQFEKNGFTFVSCNKCSTLFINPRPTTEMLKEYYNTSESVKLWDKKIFPISENTRREKIYAPRAYQVTQLCKKYNVHTKTLVDVGAGFGTFCEEVQKLEIFEKIIAVEPAQDFANSCRQKGIEVIEKPIEEVELNDVDVITNFELIEHLYNPKDFLISSSKVLPKGGLLILTTPNINGFDLNVLGKLSNNIVGPNHINYFNTESIKYLLDSAGFETIEVLTPGKLDAELVRLKILSGEMDISNQPFLKQVLIDRWDEIGSTFQQFLADSRLSSHMWVVARKV